MELKPDYAEAHNNLGNALKDAGEIGGSGRLLPPGPGTEAGLCRGAQQPGHGLKDQGKLDEALACYRRALELKPDFAEAHGNLGSALEEMGDLQGAEDSFRAALRHDPRFAFAHYKLAELLGGKLPEQDLAAQRCSSRSASGEERELTDAQRLLLHFGLAQVLDARGEYAEAAEHLARGNALQLSEWRKRGQEYDPQEHESFVARMIAVCTPDFFAAGPRLWAWKANSRCSSWGCRGPARRSSSRSWPATPRSSARGRSNWPATPWPRSADKVPTPSRALRRLDRETARRLASRHLERLRALHPAALRIVDKMPDNYLYLGLLASLFPRAKFIHCRRDLRNVAVSCWMTHFQELRWANDQQHIASRFHEYQRMMEHWRKVLPVPLLEVDYEETVADLEGVARRLVAWCGLEWEPGCLEFHRAKRPVRTASTVQVRQPVFSDIGGKMAALRASSLATLLAAIPGWTLKRIPPTASIDGNNFRSIGDCGPTPSSRPAASRRADLPADPGGRAHMPMPGISGRDGLPSGQARGRRRVHWPGHRD